MPTLESHRLHIVPFTLTLAEAALADDRTALTALLGADIPAAWPQPDLADTLPLIAESRRQYPQSAEWSGLIIHRADQRLIGDIGFKAPPDENGEVEIGYSIIPAYRRRGYATEATRLMITWAFAQSGVTLVTAECLIGNTGSIHVLAKLGLQRTGTRQDAEGLLYTWAISEAEWLVHTV